MYEYLPNCYLLLFISFLYLQKIVDLNTLCLSSSVLKKNSTTLEAKNYLKAERCQ